MNRAKVVAVSMSEKKGTSKYPVEKAELVVNHGIAGDAHAGPGIRQISLLSKESIEKFKLNKKDAEGLCEGKFAENITTEGLCLYELAIGTRLKIGTAILSVSQIGKKCHADKGCEIAKKYGICAMPKEGIFAIVLTDGVVKKDDDIEIIDD